MLKSYVSVDNILEEVNIDDLKVKLQDIVWIDLFEPTASEEGFIENLLGIDIPTHEDMHEIELSSRLYQRNNTFFMTLTIVTYADTFRPESHVVTFILHHKTLITVRYFNKFPFTDSVLKLKTNQNACRQGHSILIWMLQEIADQLADILEIIAQKIEEISFNIFNSQNTNSKSKSDLNFKKILFFIGIYENLLSKSRESLFNMARILSFVSGISYFENSDEQKVIHLMSHDVPPLIEHANFLSNKISFLLDATLGMISIEQNSIMNVLSVVSVVFLPPTLVASIYGMNFEIMPELNWPLGYLYALILMLISGLLPYQFFKFKKWL